MVHLVLLRALEKGADLLPVSACRHLASGSAAGNASHWEKVSPGRRDHHGALPPYSVFAMIFLG